MLPCFPPSNTRHCTPLECRREEESCSIDISLRWSENQTTKEHFSRLVIERKTSVTFRMNYSDMDNGVLPTNSTFNGTMVPIATAVLQCFPPPSSHSRRAIVSALAKREKRITSPAAGSRNVEFLRHMLPPARPICCDCRRDGKWHPNPDEQPLALLKFMRSSPNRKPRSDIFLSHSKGQDIPILHLPGTANDFAVE